MILFVLSLVVYGIFIGAALYDKKMLPWKGEPIENPFLRVVLAVVVFPLMGLMFVAVGAVLGVMGKFLLLPITHFL